MGLDLHAKTEALRQYEGYCYQIALYLLQREEEAVQAASEALLALGRDERFFALPEPLQRQTVKKSAMKSALEIRKRAGPRHQENASV